MNLFYDLYFQSAMSTVTGLSSITKFGSNLDIDTNSDPETIWSTGGLYQFPSSAGQISIVSSSSDDTSTGTGARTVLVQGLDENYNEVEETFTLNGVSAVTSSSSSWIRAHRAKVLSAGTGEVNAGTITITHGALTLATIPADFGQTQMAVYTIPAKKRGFIKSFSGALVRGSTLLSTGQATLAMYFRKNGVISVQQEIQISVSGLNTFQKIYPIPIVADEKTDIYINCLQVSNNNTGVFANFQLVLT